MDQLELNMFRHRINFKRKNSKGEKGLLAANLWLRFLLTKTVK